ncbi:retrovirus-related pol polyprotein from transposon TNT 1-94 [Tanacetum coccineum]
MRSFSYGIGLMMLLRQETEGAVHMVQYVLESLMDLFQLKEKGEQHEVHANENRMMMERFIQPTNDPLALVSNASVQQYPTQSSKSPQSSNEPSPADNFQLDSGSSSTKNLIESLSNSLALLTQFVVVQDVRGRYNANNQGRPFQRNNARANVVAGNVGGQNRRCIINPGQAKPIKCYNCNGLGHIARECPRPKRLQDSDYFKDKMLLMQAQENGAVLDEEQSLFLAGEQVTNFDDDVDNSPENDLALNMDHVFEADECDAFDSDVDEGPTTQTMFMANLTSEDPIYDEAGPSYDSNTPFEVQGHNTFEYHEVHEMQSDVQHNYVVDSVADYTSDSNIIPYDQYVEDNEEYVVQSNVSSVRNNALILILDEMHEHGVQSRVSNKPDMVVNDSVTSELARYKKLVGEYEKRAKFELTDREQKIDEQMRIIISDRNRKETSLKSELHSAQIILSSTVDHYKSKTEEVTLLKKNFKQKEDKFLEEFLDIKRLKDKIEDRLYKQDQSVQTVHMLCKPKSFYDEKNKVAIGYKNPLCLTRAKQAQSALYNGHVLVTTNHTPTVIHDSEDTREIAEITRKRMLLKMQSPLCVENKIFWSIDDNNWKKAETSVPKPISALTVYPPNTPVKLVPRILPTKSQVKINLYVLTQLFTEFDKTCKKRITPTGVTEGERGFEQTKRCYLTEVIPFFKTLKEHFVGVQTSLFKEVKVMEEIFDQMNNKVDKNTVDKQCAEIVKKNLLIENENLIANCLSTQLLYDVEKIHFEAPDFNSFFKIKNLEHQIQEKDNVIRDLKVLVANVNDRSCEPYNAKDVTALIEQNDCVRVELEKVKQHYKELYDSIKITRTHTSEKTSTLLNEIESLKAQLRSKESCFTSDSVKPKVLAPGMYAIDVKPIPHPLKNNRSAHLNYISHLKESVETVREIVEEARVVKPLDNALNYACQYTKLSQELLEYVIGTCPKSFNERDNKAPSTPVTRKKQVTFSDKPGTSSSNTQKHEVHQKVQQTNIPVIPSTGVNASTKARGSKPRSNTKKNRIMPAKKENKKKVEVHLRTNKATGKKFTLGKLDCGYQWRPIGKKFTLGEMCPLTKLSVKCCTGHPLVSGLRLFKTYDGESFKAQEFCRKVHRDKDVATAVYSQNRSLIHTRHNKTPYELVHDKKLDLTFLRVFGALCYPTNDSEDLGKFQAKADIGIFVGVNEPVPSATEVNAQVVPPGTSLSTMIAQDAPFTSASSSTSDMHHPVRHQGIAEEPTLEDSLITHDVLHPSFNPVTGEPGPQDHPLDNIVGIPLVLYLLGKTVSIRCFVVLFSYELSKSEPRKFSDGLTSPIMVIVITRQVRIYKVKLEEYGDVLKNNSPRLVAKGYRQEEGIDFEESFSPVAE